MSFIKLAIDFVLHMDKYLNLIIASVGGWTYLVLFIVIFIETGLVVTPFLPGDSLLFAAGAIAALGNTSSVPGFKIDVIVLYIIVAIAAILGDTVNYWIGYYVGPKVFTGQVRWLKKEYLDRAQVFYEKYGGKAIFLGRFIPIIRTFVPFVAGIGKMRYGYFISYNIFGGIIWTALFTFAGYFFGNVAFVKNNFSLVVIAIVLISVIPVVVEFLRGRKEKSSPLAETD
ncbi:MAG: DedA family protein [Anaerolineaceae bacterium]|nr:DedA family protein [Anaerolineaceae bacterium]